MTTPNPSQGGPPPDQFIPISSSEDHGRSSRRSRGGCWIIALAAFIVLCVIGGVIAGAALAMFWFNPSPVVVTSTAALENPTAIALPASATATLGVAPTQGVQPTLTPFPTNTLPPTQPASPTLPPTALPGPTATSALQPTWMPCTGSYYSRLQVGDVAYVSFDPPLPNRLRRDPNTASEIVGMLQPGERMDIIGGPVCSNQWIWWQVRSQANSLTGWTAEGDSNSYWLVPVP